MAHSPIVLIQSAILCILLLQNVSSSYTSNRRVSEKHRSENFSWQGGNCEWQCTKRFDVPPLLIISMDGFYAGYIDRGFTPTFELIRSCGTFAKYMMPSYPSKTFPNHYSIVTGLYPVHHGIVGNAMYDESVSGENKYFMKNSKNPQWYHGEPIWNTVIRNGKKSAAFHWAGSEVSIQNISIPYVSKFNLNTPYSTRAQQVLNWLKLPDDQRPAFIALYLEEPDASAHSFGPNSEEANSALIRVDGLLNFLLTALNRDGLLGCINIVIVSDHGMQSLEPDRTIAIEDLIDGKNNKIFSGAIGNVVLGNRSADVNVVAAKAKCKKGHDYRLYTRETIPARYQYADSPRVGDIIIEAVPGAITYSVDNVRKKGAGDHGYDNRIESMRAIFVAMGPSLRINLEIPPFQNIELYNLFVDLMKLRYSAPNNGTKGLLHCIFRKPMYYKRYDLIPAPQCALRFEFNSCGNRCPLKIDALLKKNCLFLTELRQPSNFITSRNICYSKLCNSSLLYDLETERPIMAESFLDRTQIGYIEEEGCTINILKTTPENCSETNGHKISIIASNGPNRLLSQGHINVEEGFYNGIWKSVESLIDKYKQIYNRMIRYTGPIYKFHSANGKRERGEPSHVFIILVRCTDDEWSDNGIACKNLKMTTTLTFILPNVPEDFNCLTVEDYLFQHTARIRDVELLTKLQFFANQQIWPSPTDLRLRTAIADKLWEL